MDRRKVGALAVVAMLAAAACQPAGGETAAPSASAGGGEPTTAASEGATCDKGTVKVAVELPFQGSEFAASDPILKGVRLALKDSGGCVGGYTVEVPDSAVFDDSVNGAHDAQTGARNMQAIAADPDMVAVIGPLNSSVAQAQIPISNEAGLLQCSPANTNEGLTKPEFGALDIRKANPDKINYVRVVTTDDKQGPAAAKYTVENLGAKNIYIIDDTETFGAGIAKNYEAEAVKLGASIAGHDGAPKTTTDYGPLLTAAAAKNPDAIYFGGVTSTGGAKILKAAVQAGLGDIPFVGSDGINDGSTTSVNSFLNLAQDDAKNSYSTLAAIGDFPGKADFDAAYAAEYGTDPGSYSATGYSCMVVVLDALKRAAETAPGDMAGLREAVRAAAVDPSITYTAPIGEFNFDENGDTSQLIISIYAFDPAAPTGQGAETGDWVFKEQIDYAAP